MSQSKPTIPARILRFLAIVTIAVGITSCSSTTPQKGTKPIAIVGIMPIYKIANRIAGDSISIECMMPRGGNPETYEPTLAQIAQAENCDAFMCISNTGFETEIARRITSDKSIRLTDLSKGIDLLFGTHSNCTHHNHHGKECGHNDADPHVWSSAKNMKIIAANILSTFTDIDPSNSDYYIANFESLVTEIDSIDTLLAQTLAPHHGKAFAVWHPSLGYFARDYGLRQISIGGSEHKESSAKQLIDKISSTQNTGTTIFVIQQNYDDRQAQVINEHIGARLVEIDPLCPDWSEPLINVANAIATSQND